jgi:hypothetical protein
MLILLNYLSGQLLSRPRGGAPGGATPYVTGISDGGPRWARPWCAGRLLHKGFAKGCLASIPRGLANPWRLPALHPFVFEGTETGKGDPVALKITETGRQRVD